MNISMALDPLTRKAQGKHAQSQAAIVVEKDDKIKKNLETYTQFLQNFWDPSEFEHIYDYSNSYYSQISKLEMEVLSPGQLRRFFMIIEEQKVSKRNWAVYQNKTALDGVLMGYLIQGSYDAGHNDFSFDSYRRTRHFGYGIKGTKERALRIRLHSDFNIKSFKNAVYCEAHIGGKSSDAGNYVQFSKFIIEGDPGYCVGNGAKHSYFKAIGDAKSAGESAEDCHFEIMGNAGSFLGSSAKRSKFLVSGDVDSFYANNSKQCEFFLEGNVENKKENKFYLAQFHTSNPKTYQAIKEQIGWLGLLRLNRVYLAQ